MIRVPFAICFACLAGVALLPGQTRYSSPEELALSTNGQRLYVSCTGRDEIVVINTRTRCVVGRLTTGRKVRGLVLSRDGKKLYVANSWDDTIGEIDVSSLRMIREFPVGKEPVGIALGPGRMLYVANRISGDVSGVDPEAGGERFRVPVGPGASYVTAANLRTRLYVSRIYPNRGRWRDIPLNEIVEIDTDTQQVANRYPVLGAGGIFQMAAAPGGSFALAAHLRPKNLVPLAHVERGGVFGNCLALFGPSISHVTVLPLDEIENYFAQPFAIAITSDLSRVFVSGSGVDEVAVLDGRRLLAAATVSDPDGLANDLSASARYVIKRIRVGRNPKGMALSRDGKRLYVANRLDDTITCIDAARNVVTGTIALNPQNSLTPERRGERLFYAARFSFGRQFSCGSCHIDGITDGLSWDLEPDGFGQDIVATQTLEVLAETAPYKWNGTNADLAKQAGERSEKFFFRSEGFRGPDLEDVVSFLKSVHTRPNRSRLPSGLTAAQTRGKAIFERNITKTGTPILVWLQCPTCHSGPHFSNGQLADVGTGKATDRSGVFKVTHLVNVGYRESYLHDGSAPSLKEIWTRSNPRSEHGVTTDLSSSDLDDLVEYLKTL